MIHEHTFKPQEILRFDTGQLGKYLIIRECSGEITARADNLRRTALVRGDIVDIQGFNVLELSNTKDDAVTVEYQLSDLMISTKAQRVNIANAVTVSEILEPVSVNKVAEPVKSEQFGNWEITEKAQSISKGVQVTISGGAAHIAENPNRKGIIISASEQNSEVAKVQGTIPLFPSGTAALGVYCDIEINGAEGDTFFYSEIS
ncbi:hypothetical protein DBT82_RS20760 [Vibrio parahaemolyticus]|nr:hypothetical protein [Vibrio parahaemolyticus]EJG0350551.1 hypothetical protein [Vibrio parahaemolyticus]EJG0554095.1 hypothetical protein [Vibrio parahaemolyticus]MCC3821595.1 hypothetical protein [Vibrio parahaemolyticus]HAS6490057.1 hypothetical protein [Vibrio parahaemolyticus]